MAGIAGGAAATGEGGLAPSGKGGAPAISGSSGTGSSGKSVGAGGGNGTAGSGVGGASGSSGSAGQSGNTSQGAQGGAGGNAAAGTGGTAPDAGAAGSSTCSTDACPAKAGVTIACEKRFMFGVNFAWVNFGSDFGGGAQGVAQNQARIAQDLKDMKDNGVDVIRWWMHPSMFDGGGVRFDSGGTPQALGGSELADIDAALTLAAE